MIDATKRGFFLHIPKTGGRSVVRHLEDWVGRARVLEVRANEDFLTESDTNLNKYQVVHGHQHFTFEAIVGDAPMIMTILREPVERVISSYEYILRKHDHVLRPELLSRVDSLETYVSDQVFRFHSANMQTRMLGSEANLVDIVEGARSGRLPVTDAALLFRRALKAPCDMEMLKRACARLAGGRVLFGLTEDLRSAIETLATAFEVPAPEHLYTENSAPSADAQSRWDRYPDRAIEAVIRANAFDLDLYAFAVSSLGA